MSIPLSNQTADRSGATLLPGLLELAGRFKFESNRALFPHARVPGGRGRRRPFPTVDHHDVEANV